jgi:hypothetical protein
VPRTQAIDRQVILRFLLDSARRCLTTPQALIRPTRRKEFTCEVISCGCSPSTIQFFLNRRITGFVRQAINADRQHLNLKFIFNHHSIFTVENYYAFQQFDALD